MPIKMGSVTLYNGGTAKWGSTALDAIKWSSTEVWRREQTLLSNWSTELARINDAYVYDEQYSSEFTFNATTFSKIRIAGTLKCVVNDGSGTAEYGTYGTWLDLQYKEGSTWKTLRLSDAKVGGVSLSYIWDNSYRKVGSSENGNGVAGAIGGAVGGSNTGGTYTTQVANTYNINNLWCEYGATNSRKTFSGNVVMRLRIKELTANAGTTAAIKGSCSGIYIYET